MLKFLKVQLEKDQYSFCGRVSSNPAEHRINKISMKKSCPKQNTHHNNVRHWLSHTEKNYVVIAAKGNRLTPLILHFGAD